LNKLHSLSAILLMLIAFSSCRLRPAVVADAPAEPLDQQSYADSLALAAAEENPANTQDESFDPFLLPESELIFNPGGGYLLEEFASDVESLQELNELNANPEQLEAATRVIIQDGYQVQLFASPDAAQAEEIKSQALLLFPDQPVDMVWDPPNYKVRLGMFAIQDDARELKRQALRLGYRDAWVVRYKGGLQQ
jgi:hypothetical protein